MKKFTIALLFVFLLGSALNLLVPIRARALWQGGAAAAPGLGVSAAASAGAPAAPALGLSAGTPAAPAAFTGTPAAFTDTSTATAATAASTSTPAGSEAAPEAADDTAAQAQLQALAAEQPIMALVYLSDEYAIRQQPWAESDEVVRVPSGQQVLIQDFQRGTYGEAWMHVSTTVQDTVYTGFVARSNLACSDERFLAWEAAFGMAAGAARGRSLPADVTQFPASYQASLLALKSAHPNWTFVKMNTNLEWNTVVAEEMVQPRSLVPNSFDDYMKAGVYGTQGWSYASSTALKYYLDPRNWLNEEYIFQFEQLTYNASYHSEAAVQTFLNATFMRGAVPQDSRTYARLFWDVGQGLGVSPFHLASRVYSEQGAGGTSALISGTWPGYEGLYNYYNISASGSTNQEVVTNGLAKARAMGWTSPASSIQGGADIISANYIRKGQDTLYLQKFDVDATGGLYSHQYQQAVHSPASESRSIRQLYVNANALNNTFVFKVPVYNNMEATPPVLPITNYNITLTPPAGYTSAKAYINGEERAATQQGGSFVVNTGGAHATSAVMYKYDGAGVPVGMYVWLLNYRNGLYTVTAMPELENLLTYHGFSIRITGNTGIRFKTGIGADLRAQLTGAGAGGCKLKEYGTLVMNNANRGILPFIRDGDKVVGGQSYGITSSGTFMDAVYEIVNGRYRYTSVLTGLPASQYKTEFAFRGYCIVVREGREYILYGPPVAKSIYSLSQQVLASGEYPAGTPAYDFLTKLIQDAG